MLCYEIIPVTTFEQNCTLLWDDTTQEAIFIDAGGDLPLLQRKLTEKKLKLVALWLTHGHLDHVGAVGELAEIYKVPVIGPAKPDQFWLDFLPQQAKMFGSRSIPKPVNVTQWLVGGETLTLGQYTAEVRFTPGHTPGHVVFYIAKANLLWTGDVLFAGSIGRTDFPQGNFEHLVQSIRTQLFTLPPATQFICGHGPMSTIGHEMQHNPFVSGRAG